MTRKIAASVFTLVFTSVLLFAAAQETLNLKRYLSPEYGFEISYPADWEFVPGDEAGETRYLFGLEVDGPTQSQDGGESFDDGAIITVRITGTSGTVKDSGAKSGGSSAPSDWVKRNTAIGPGDGLKTIAVDANGFSGVIKVVCTGSNPCKPFEEEGAAYRTLPSGRVLLIRWDREAGSNDFSYEKYFLPMLSSFKSLK